MKHTHEDGTPFNKEEFLHMLEIDKEFKGEFGTKGVDQIAKALDTLVNNPDCRRILVNAWNVGEIKNMTLPPCHFGFQLWTRELSAYERENHFAYVMNDMTNQERCELHPNHRDEDVHEKMDVEGVPRRAISLTWQQRSCDFPLGIPFNVASYGALLMIFGELVNMVPETLTGMLGDCHIYRNQIEGVNEQISRDSFDLPKLTISTELWNPENVLGTNWDEIIKGIEIDDFILTNYESHPLIKYPLSN